MQVSLPPGVLPDSQFSALTLALENLSIPFKNLDFLIFSLFVLNIIIIFILLVFILFIPLLYSKFSNRFNNTRLILQDDVE